MDTDSGDKVFTYHVLLSFLVLVQKTGMGYTGNFNEKFLVLFTYNTFLSFSLKLKVFKSFSLIFLTYLCSARRKP